MEVSRLEILSLYKKLMQYSKTLTLTDTKYFRKRIASEFRRNKTIKNPEEIAFAYKVCPIIERRSITPSGISSMMLVIRSLLNFPKIHPFSPFYSVKLKHTIDYSCVPKINECDLSEQFVRGGGPGGSAVNKNANCVVLTHKPTGIVIKCHISRCQDENRKLAREMLITKLDDAINGDESVTAQKKRLLENKFKKTEYKKKRKSKLKEEWKKREGLV